MPSKRFPLVAIGTALTATVLGGYFSWAQSRGAPESAEYNPVINPANFVPQVNNKYFALKPGTKFTLRNKAGTDRFEHTVTNETKTVMGVKTTVVRVREWRNGVLSEDTRDWYAQDKDGNVWYFGEAVDNYKDGKIANHRGSWEAGVDGAKPGIIMPGNPKIGEKYRQEYYKGHAEDMGTVIATGKKVTVAAGTFEDCLQIQDSTSLAPSIEHKFYCPAVGYVALETSSTGTVLEELVAVSSE